MMKNLSSVLLLALCAGQVSAQVFIVSASSGDWNNPATWSPPVVPGPADQITVSTGHTVYLASAGVPATPAVLVDSLTVNGTLLSDNTPGFSADTLMEVNRLKVNAGGSLVMQNGTGTSPGGSLTVYGRTILDVTVDGSVIMGSGNLNNLAAQGTGGPGVPSSGSLRVYGFDTNFTQLPISLFSSTGTIQAGSNGGWVDIWVDNASIQGGLIAAGDDPTLCQPGSVTIYAIQNLSVGGTAEIRSGDCPTPTIKAFGLVALASANQLTIGTNSLVNARTNGCAWIWGGNATILGTIIAPCLNYDPPDLTLTGTGRLLGDKVVVGAQNFISNSLTGPGAIDATDTIEFFINPGGKFDLRGLAKNVNWFTAANSITIRADAANILTDPGVSIATLMSPPPIILPAEPLRELLIPQGGASVFAPPGSVVRLPRNVMNFGSSLEKVKVDISDSNGWLLNPVSSTQNLTAGSLLRSVLDIAVPPGALPGDFTEVTINATAINTPSFVENVTFMVVVPPACPADFDFTGFVDTDDFDKFVAAFELGDPAADFDASGFTDTDDYDAFVTAFTRGC
jgi:hypothetical protein